MKKVSVILPVYNAKDTVQDTIDSVLGQTLDNFELIIIDDGSDFETKKILDNNTYHTQIRLISQVNRGVSAARNVGIDNAGGKYLFFIDSDDIIESDLLENLYDYSEKNNLDLACSEFEEINSTKLQYRDIHENDAIATNDKEFSLLQERLFLQSACAKLFKREIISRKKIYFPEDMALGEDLYFVYSYIIFVDRVGIVSKSKYVVQNINDFSLSKRYVDNLEESLVKQVQIRNKFEIMHPYTTLKYYKTHVDFSFYQLTLYITNLYKLKSNLNYFQKRYMLKGFLLRHKEWWNIQDVDKKPKSKKDKFMYYIVSSNNITIILLFFMFKEKIRRMKFYFGKRR